VAVGIALADVITHEPIKAVDILVFAAVTVLVLMPFNAAMQPLLYRFSPYHAMIVFVLGIGIIIGALFGLRTALPEFEEATDRLADAIGRNEAAALAVFPTIDVIAVAISHRTSLRICHRKDIWPTDRNNLLQCKQLQNDVRKRVSAMLCNDKRGRNTK